MYVPNQCCLHNIFEWYSHVNICMYLISVVYIIYLNDIAM